MIQVISILDELRQATRPYHERLEATLVFMKPGLTRADYQEMLRKLWGLYMPLEHQIASIPDLSRYIDYDVRRKQPLLEEDMHVLGVSSAQLMPCPQVPDIRTVPQALGCLYVLEGSTLGGQLIARHVKKQLGLDVATGCSFFHGYGDKTGLMWREFCNAMNAYPENDAGDRHAILETAIQTFIVFEEWFREG
jgi:heme oxygenase (biliverdin-IX-beta and delta-forming)